ncbi:hypothetical protein ACFPLB_09300 [Aquamicrobium segne]|uniref:Uncharacterized protein n=1 Tax=Aquamicrobium segne TaxID=469547 RepID=A0ABW0GZ59_9HYPH
MQETIKEASTNAEKKRLIEAKIEQLHARLVWVADALIPSDPEGVMPSAKEAGVVDKYLARALLLRDDMADQFFADIEGLPNDAPADGLAELTALGAGFGRISRLVSGAYFLDEELTGRLQYRGQEEIVRDQDYDPMIAAIETVLNRGQLYVDAPDD